jgi:hypothetical protein
VGRAKFEGVLRTQEKLNNEEWRKLRKEEEHIFRVTLFLTVLCNNKCDCYCEFFFPQHNVSETGYVSVLRRKRFYFLFFKKIVLAILYSYLPLMTVYFNRILSRLWMNMTGFGLESGFIDYLQVVTANHCNTIANFHTLQITTVHANSFQSALSSPVVAW